MKVIELISVVALAMPTGLALAQSGDTKGMDCSTS